MISTLFFFCHTGGLFPTGSHEYEVFRFALAQHQDVPKLVPQVDMVDTGSSFAMTYACKFTTKEIISIPLVAIVKMWLCLSTFFTLKRIQKLEKV